MKTELILPAARIEAETARGRWPNRLFTDYLDAAATARPDKVAVTDFNSMTGGGTTLTYGELRRIVDRIALGLVARGIEPGDVVSCQLPNWWQFIALHLACVRIGAVTNPLMPIFRQRELVFMLGLAESRLMVVPRLFRNCDYPLMLEELRAGLPHLRDVLVIGGRGAQSFEETLVEHPWEDEMDAAAVFRARKPSPNDLTQLLYTSGTTGEPKGVMHTANTLISNVIVYAERYALTHRDVVLMASPLAHQIGFMYGMMLAVMPQAKIVLQDIWDPEQAVRIIQDHGVTLTKASTSFLADLADTPALERHDIGSLRVFISSGAPIPRVLVKRAQQRLDAAIVSAWGMTELGAMTSTLLGDPEEKTFGTDGVALPGAEVRVVDDDGNPLPAGEPGLLQARGASGFVGYLKRPELFATDAEGWFGTGDLACMDGDGYIRIVGRAKDIIIRGGENVSVIEIEELLYRHPAVQDAAVVGMPDPRLGERVCAFVTLRPGATLTFEAMTGYLEENKMACQYFPERLEVIDEMPRTPAGKIQKFRLREVAKTLTPRGATRAERPGAKERAGTGNQC